MIIPFCSKCGKAHQWAEDRAEAIAAPNESPWFGICAVCNGDAEKMLAEAARREIWFAIEVRHGGRDFSVCNMQQTLEAAISRAKKELDVYGGPARVTRLRMVVWDASEPDVAPPPPVADILPDDVILATSTLYRLLTALDEGGMQIVTLDSGMPIVNQDVRDALDAARKVCYGLIRHYAPVMRKRGGPDAE